MGGFRWLSDQRRRAISRALRSFFEGVKIGWIEGDIAVAFAEPHGSAKCRRP